MTLKIKNIISSILLLLAFTLPGTPILIDSVLIIIALVLSLIVLFGERPKLKVFLKIYSPLLLFYLVLIVGLVYSENIGKGLNQLEKKLTFVILPLVFYSVKDHKNLRKIVQYFSYGVLFSALLCDSIALIKYGSFVSYGYTLLLQPLDIDPTYFSMYCVFAIVFFFKELLIKNTKYNIALYALVIFYLLYFFLKVGSKIGLVIAPIVALSLIVHLLYRKPKKTVLIFVLIFIGFLIASYFSPLTYNRFYAPLIDNNLDFYQLRMNFFNERYYAWKCSLESINLNSIWFGYGTGDDINTLKDCYKNYRRSYVLNSHNMYFSSIIKNGIIGFIALFTIIIQGFKVNKIQYVVFAFIILFTGLTESILERQKGIIFFALFYTLILTEIQLKKESRCAE